jgi:uncharacterized protein DUF3455
MRKNVFVFALAVITLFGTGAFTVSMAQSPRATITTPPVPPGSGLGIDPGFKPFLLGHGVGTQNYVCKSSGGVIKYVLFTPEATLFDDDFRQLITHFFSPNLKPEPGTLDPNTDPTVVVPDVPDGTGAIRVTWEDSRDTSTIWAKLVTAFTVDETAVAWLKLQVVGHADGPTGGDRLSATKFVQRLNTRGGLPPKTGCSTSTDVGNTAFVHYSADYFFYIKAE